MKIVALGEILDVQNGYAFDSDHFSDSGMPLIRIRDIKNGNSTEIKYNGDFDDRFIVKAGDYLIGMDGEFRCYKWKGPDALLNQRVCRLTAFKEEVNPDYIYYGINSFLKRIEANTSFVTVKHISSKQIKEIKFPLPSISEQRRIADLLSKAESLIAKRKESIALLDEYLKSVFLEMFGDPVRNERGWEKLQLYEFGQSRLGKMLDAGKSTGTHLKPYLRNSNVQWFRFDLSDLKEMDFSEHDRVEFELRKGDVLMCEGGEIGRCAIWREDISECYFQKAIHRIRLVPYKCSNEYFVYMFWLYSMQGGLDEFKSAATISHLTGENLKSIRLPIPPIKLQLEFSTIVEKTQFLKAKYQTSLENMESLYIGLSHRVFESQKEISRFQFQ